MIKLSKVLVLFFVIQSVNGLYGMSSAIGTKDLVQVATFWISTVLPTSDKPYDTKLGKAIVNGKYKPWLTQDNLEAEVDKQLKDLSQIKKLGAGGTGAGGKLKGKAPAFVKAEKYGDAYVDVIAGEASDGLAALKQMGATDAEIKKIRNDVAETLAKRNKS